MSDFPLSEEGKNVLSKGLKFVPTPRQVTKTPILEATHSFSRQLKLKYRFRNSQNFHKPKFTKKSTWTPSDASVHPKILETINAINKDISELSIPRELPNLSQAELESLKNIKNNSEIVIKPADKGGCIVILNRASYVNEGKRQLNDERYYKKITEPLHIDNASKIDDILWDLCQRQVISDKQFQYLKSPESPRPRIFYLLPKIHKDLSKWATPNQPPGRPIVSNVSSESSAISEYIDSFLTPLSKLHDSYIKDTNHFLLQVRQVPVHDSSFLFTIDVESMYTNIDHEEAIEAVRELFAEHEHRNRPDDEIIELLKICLKCNDFVFDGETYLQTKGISMGQKFAPALANIFMSKFEQGAMARSFLKPAFYKRFLDDIFGIWNYSVEQFWDFINILNTHNRFIRVTASIHPLSQDYLDVTAFKGPGFRETGRLDTKVYFKPTDSHALLHKSSFHTRSTFAGILKSQILRFNRICSQKSDFEEACSILFRSLRTRGYSARFLRKIKHETLCKISTGELMPPPPCLGPDPPPEEELVSEICGSRFCGICHLVAGRHEAISSVTKCVFKFRHDMNCNTRNMIYLINCKSCNKQYIGESRQSLRYRADGHRRDILDEVLNRSVAKHFNSCFCSFDDFEITPIFICPRLQTEEETKKLRLSIENYFIRLFETYLPYGMNVSNTRQPDSETIMYSVPFSGLATRAAGIVRQHYHDLQESLPEVFHHYLITGYKHHDNLRQMLVSAKLKSAEPGR